MAVANPTSAAPSAAKLGRLLLVAVGLPALLTLVDRLILGQLTQSRVSPFAAIAAFAVYAGQLALLSWAVARYAEPWPLRWILWIWSMLLIDLQLALMVGDEAYRSLAIDCLATGVLAGQVGALLVFGILGTGPLVWRLPSLLVLLYVGWHFYRALVRISHDGPWNQLSWNDLLWAQAAILAALCGVLRLAGFELAKLVHGSDPASQNARSVQFGIRDVLVGTTCLAVLLAFAKAGDLLTSQFLKSSYNSGFLFVALVAICTAAALLVALWAALGRGSITYRVLVLILISLGLGAPLALFCVFVGQPQLQVGTLRDLRLVHWYYTGYWWIGWMFLAGALLANLLVIFRTLDYRLVRRPAKPK